MVTEAISPCKRPIDLLGKRISSTMETSVLLKEVYGCVCVCVCVCVVYVMYVCM
jgi:hypothetical protein